MVNSCIEIRLITINYNTKEMFHLWCTSIHSSRIAGAECKLNRN